MYFVRIVEFDGQYFFHTILTVMKELTAIIRIGLGAVFLYAGSAKLSSLDEFGATIELLFPITAPAGTFLGGIVAAAECVIGGMMVFGYQIRFASGSIGVMVTGFMLIFLPSVFDPASNIECGCFGDQSSVDSFFFIRNTFILTAAIYLRQRKDHRWSVDALLRQ